MPRLAFFALLAGILSFIELAIVIGIFFKRKQVKKTELSTIEAADVATKPLTYTPATIAYTFEGKAAGARYETSFSVAEILNMWKQGKRSEALPGLLAILGGLSAFLSWSLFLCSILGLSTTASWITSLVVFGFVLSAAWPRS